MRRILHQNAWITMLKTRRTVLLFLRLNSCWLLDHKSRWRISLILDYPNRALKNPALVFTFVKRQYGAKNLSNQSGWVTWMNFSQSELCTRTTEFVFDMEFYLDFHRVPWMATNGSDVKYIFPLCLERSVWRLVRDLSRTWLEVEGCYICGILQWCDTSVTYLLNKARHVTEWKG